MKGTATETSSAPDLVIGLDSSTQSTKAVAWTRDGVALAEARMGHDMHHPGHGLAEQDPAQWWQALNITVRRVADQVGAHRIAAIAISTQRETAAFVDADMNAVRPAIVWLDERGRSQLGSLQQRLGGDAIHRITGKPFDLTPSMPRIDWLRQHEPQTLARTAHVLDPQAYLVAHLTGRRVTSWISADPSGLFDIHAKIWDPTILTAIGLRADQLPEALPPGTRAGSVSAQAASATGLPAGLPVFLAGGDGQCAGLGTNAMRAGTVYLNLGTALILGAWTPDPLISRHWRTMTSPTGAGYFCEGVQRTGAFLLNWLVDTFFGGRADPEVFSRLDAQAAALPLGSDGVTISPYLSGCMDPHWDPNARAAITGLAAHHGPAHIYRAALEALTAESVRCLIAMADQGLAPGRIVAMGGGAVNRLWMQMFADASGLPVTRSRSVEASALGAGMIAVAGLGWYPTLSATAAAMSAEDCTVQPDPATHGAWAGLLERQAAVYTARRLSVAA